MNYYKITGYFLSLVTTIGLTSSLAKMLQSGIFDWWIFVIIGIGFLFYISACSKEKIGQWIQIITLYIICFMAITIDKDYGDVALIMALLVFLSQVYELTKKYSEIFYGLMIFVLFTFGYFVIDGSMVIKFVETWTRTLLTILFMVVICAGVKTIKGENNGN